MRRSQWSSSPLNQRAKRADSASRPVRWERGATLRTRASARISRRSSSAGGGQLSTRASNVSNRRASSAPSPACEIRTQPHSPTRPRNRWTKSSSASKSLERPNTMTPGSAAAVKSESSGAPSTAWVSPPQRRSRAARRRGSRSTIQMVAGLVIRCAFVCAGGEPGNATCGLLARNPRAKPSGCLERSHSDSQVDNSTSWNNRYF